MRRVRLARNLTQTQLGVAAGYSTAHVSKVEAGLVTVTRGFAEGCDRAFGTGDLFVEQLRRLEEGEHPTWFAPFLQYEREAREVQDYSTVFIFGLLQTPEYARAALEAATPGVDPRDVTAKVAGRVRRREILDRDVPPRVWVLLHEACLHAQIGTPRVMADQLAYLETAVLRYPTLTVQVLPFAAADAAHATPFTLLHFEDERPAVHVEGPQGGRPYEDKGAVANSKRIYDRMRACALSPTDSLALINEAREDHERHARMDQVQLQRRRGGKLRRVGAGSRVRRNRPRPGQ